MKLSHKICDVKSLTSEISKTSSHHSTKR